MQKTPSKIHRMVVFIGLAAAIVLCAFSCIALGRVRPPCARPSRAGSSIEELDALAKPHFDQAERNVPSVVAEMSSTGNFLKLCWLMAGDKISGSHDTRDYIESKIHARIVVPCQRGADVYGCNVDSAAIRNELLASGCNSAVITAYATGSLALEAVFIKSTMASLRSVLGAIIARLSSAYGGGAACAAADGPLPIGDVVGVALAAGGTIWSISDICQAQKQLKQELTDILYQSIRECRESCRKLVAS